MLVFERANLVFLFNLHPVKSFMDYRIGVRKPGKYHAVLNSDAPEFDGHDRVDTFLPYFTIPISCDGHADSIQVQTVFRLGLPSLPHSLSSNNLVFIIKVPLLAFSSSSGFGKKFVNSVDILSKIFFKFACIILMVFL